MQQPGQSYLDNKVVTASQPRLQLMLLEGAVRFSKQAQQLWKEDAGFASVDQSLSRVAEILEELVRGASSGDSEISKSIEDQYAAIYRELASCRINQAPELLDACLELLQYHRETWKLVCEQIEAEAKPPQSPGAARIHLDFVPGESFSLEA
ncbi:flagellar export chaperone FliS [Bythopirellula goksoeyrii]|uniref:Flagellar protein FliS n=1 Tax=Bythopirellula goksoeyrii TaxID=1400387 RepID=A0A5B9Q965_9BACT|nr:flagellar export chaperone FliS [Bythopirellula goksoeyrii]QEG34170.1 Flagellar protein FliS [Bythopirellula goksoeyrii]